MKVGLTGGIGAGKSTVAARFAELGALIVDADALAREVVEPGSAGLRAVIERFGMEVLEPSGALDRAALGRLIFADDAARRDLEAILHPRIAARTAERMALAAPHQVIVHDIPLLIELHREDDYDHVVVVDAPVQTRIDRLMRTRGMARAEAEGRIRAQADEKARRAVADTWIENDGDEAVLRAQVDAAWARFTTL